jgi:hypothetical protein
LKKGGVNQGSGIFAEISKGEVPRDNNIDDKKEEFIYNGCTRHNYCIDENPLFIAFSLHEEARTVNSKIKASGIYPLRSIHDIIKENTEIIGHSYLLPDHNLFSHLHGIQHGSPHVRHPAEGNLRLPPVRIDCFSLFAKEFFTFNGRVYSVGILPLGAGHAFFCAP